MERKRMKLETHSVKLSIVYALLGNRGDERKYLELCVACKTQKLSLIEMKMLLYITNYIKLC